MRIVGFSLLLGIVLCSCHAKVSGNLQLDGAKFPITECRSGRVYGFSGIQLGDPSGRHLRLLAQADGTVKVALFQPEAARGALIGSCGTLVMHAQSSHINSVTNLRGTAALSCKSNGHQLSGKVTFENCH